MRVWVKVLAWTGVSLLGLGVLLFVIGPALFASVAYPLPQEYQQTVCDEAKNFSVEPKLLAGLIFTESRWNPTAQSGAGAQGLTQFISGTAISVAKHLEVSPFQPSDLKRDPKMAIRFGAYYLGDLVNRRYGGNKTKALIAYNGGGGAVIGYEQGYPFKGTLAYANKVIAVGDMYEKIYGDWCSREDLPDLSAKSQNPTDLLKTINIADFWKNLFFNRDIPTNDPQSSGSINVDSFWKNLLSN
ncbi:MAG: transglycosylase SLT domain-containing protein [Candidatus Berkelbacteria bacterium]|nr:transglycosylase SLT domain-containing protein [Candidatus Berkelbacteria bacterium]